MVYKPPISIPSMNDIPQPIHIETDGALDNPGVNPDDLLAASPDPPKPLPENTYKHKYLILSTKPQTPKDIKAKLDLQMLDAEGNMEENVEEGVEIAQDIDSDIGSDINLESDLDIESTVSPEAKAAGVTSSMAQKGGLLSSAAKQKIRELSEKGVSIKRIAEYLNRSSQTIYRCLKKELIAHHELTKEEQDYNILEDKLLKREYYGELVTQFSDRELEYFQNTWIHLMLQFRDNVLFAEELQLKQLITIDILLNRCMQERKRHLQDVDRLQQLLDDEYNKDEDTRDDTMMSSLETQLSYARNSIGSYTTEYTKLLDKQQGINKDLKATRDQRIKRVEDSKTSFSNWVRMLEDETLRQRIGDNAELLKLAKDKAAKELSELHTYVDNQVDVPLLNEHTADVMTEDK